MRELLAEELCFVAGGVKPITELPGYTVRPPATRNDTLPYSPPGTSGGTGGGGSTGGTANGGINGGGNISTQTAAGIARIKEQLGIDLTAQAKMSPTLANEIALATATYNFNFVWGSGGSHLDWKDQVSGTITIDTRYKGNMGDFVQQMSHEMEHAGHRVSDNPKTTPLDVYLRHNMANEGFATIANERVQHEILAAGGGDIQIAGTNKAAYNAEYERFVNHQVTLEQAAINIGSIYGASEHTDTGESYHDYYMNYYRTHGGYQ